MANIKISNLPVATSPVASTDVVPVVQGGITKQAALNTLGYLASGTGAVTTTVQAKLRQYITPEDFGAAGNGTTDDTAAVQAAITALTSGQTLRLIGDYKITGTGLTITNKSRICIEGPGRLKLVGASHTAAVVLCLVGTCDSITIDGVSILGESIAGGIASAAQYGIYNYSGQTLSNITVRNCKLYGLQAGIAFNADFSGTITNVVCVNNFVDTMIGTDGGQGYGIFTDNALGVLIAGNQIANCQRHSIYLARQQTSTIPEHGVLCTNNIIRNHRQAIATGDLRPAIYARGYGVDIVSNQIINYFDGAIGAQVGLDEGAPAGNIRILSNQLSGRGNVLQSINIGERLDPTTYRLNNVEVSGNSIRSDMTVCGNGVEINVCNGQNVLVTRNHIHTEKILNLSVRPIAIGQYSAQGFLDLDNVQVKDNIYTGTLDASAVGTTPVRLTYFYTAVATVPAGGASRVIVTGNEVDPLLLLATAEYAATKTNTKVVVRDQWGGIPGIYTVGATTLTVYGGVTYMVITNTGAVSIPTINDGVPQQVVTLVFGDANTTIKHATGNIRLVGGVDFVSSSRDTLTLIYSPVYAQWLEVGRAVVA